MERLGLEQKSGDAEPSKQELTRQLASRWNTLPPEDKKIYYDMYEKSKEKYAVEMQLYSSRTKPPSDNIPTWCYYSFLPVSNSRSMDTVGQ